MRKVWPGKYAPRHSKRPYCHLHRTNEVRLDDQCAYCRKPLHFHQGLIKLARRGMAQHIPCPHCKGSNLLMVASNGKRWEMAMEDQGTLVLQLTLDGKAH